MIIVYRFFYRDSPATIGPMARNVDDLVSVMRASFGLFHKEDFQTCPMKFQEDLYIHSQSKKIKIGVIKTDNFIETCSDIQEAIEDVTDFLKSENHEVVKFENFDGYEMVKLFNGLGMK